MDEFLERVASSKVWRNKLDFFDYIFLFHSSVSGFLLPIRLDVFWANRTTETASMNMASHEKVNFLLLNRFMNDLNFTGVFTGFILLDTPYHFCNHIF